MSVSAEAWNAIATGFSGLVALALGTYGVLRDRGERAAAKQARRESLARQVQLWVENGSDGATIKIRNGGPQAITDIFGPTIGLPAQMEIAGGLEPGSTRRRVFLPPVMPGETLPHLVGPRSQLKSPFEIEFTDGHGVRWARRSDGSLNEITPKPKGEK